MNGEEKLLCLLQIFPHTVENFGKHPPSTYDLNHASPYGHLTSNHTPLADDIHLVSEGNRQSLRSSSDNTFVV